MPPLPGTSRASSPDATPGQFARPTHVLFNGGVLHAPFVRNRLSQVLQQWLGTPVKILSGEDLMHAVARGAAYYGAARHGDGVRIRGGVSRSYYVGVESAMPAVPGFPTPLKALTVAQFGMEEGTALRIPGRDFGVVVGEPAEFRFFSSATRKSDAPGDIIEDIAGELDAGNLAEMPGMQVNFADEHGGVVPVTFETVITETRSAPALVRGRRWPPLEARVQRPRAGPRHRMNTGQICVGIDLGTTNSALAWVDPAEAGDASFPPIHIFDVPQLVAPNRVEPRRTLPSFLLIEDGQPVGAYAREQGAIVPTKLVHSAKSWLSNPRSIAPPRSSPGTVRKPAASSRLSKSPRAT